jgi:hypothetical protein
MKGTKRPKAELLLRTVNNGQAVPPTSVPPFAEPAFDIEVNLEAERAPRAKAKKGKGIA